MKHDYFLRLEPLPNSSSIPLPEVLEQLAFNDKGLIPVITQDASTMAVLMFAWMNREALEQTLLTRQMTYWSRSRNQLWVKGESSGHFQALVAMSFDCDGDAILCQVVQQGAACHTGRQSCFYLSTDPENRCVTVEGDSG